MDYQELDQSLQGRCQSSRKVGHNTYAKRRSDGIAIMLHATDIATFKPNRDITLNSGGWRTVTTKERINHFILRDWRLFQDKGIWYIKHLINQHWDGGGLEYIFADGMTLHADGTATGAGKATPNIDKKIKATVKKFAQLCADSLPLPKPDSGDCWFCHMSTDSDQSLGDATKNTEHLVNHMNEGYVVPSLVHRALKEKHNAQAAFWGAFGQVPVDDFTRHAVKRAVYRYTMQRLGYAV